MGCIHQGRKVYSSNVAGDVHQCTKFKENCVQLDSQYEAIKPGLIAPHHSCESCEFFSDKQPLLTIGMAYYRDWPGLWATIQSLFLHHQSAMEFVEIVVVDNDPNGKPDEASESNHSWKARQICERVGARYEHYTAVAGTAAAKGRIFDVATGDWVLVVDCHVMLPTMVLDLFLGWIRQQPADCKDLIQGPLIGDGGLNDIIGTQMNPGWGSLMYGQWHTDPRVRESLEPFEIQMHGCGLFACKRDQWPGFHPLLRGFGPEEWHIHQRVRRNGGKVYCLPFLKWCHRFGNPDGTRPPGLAPEERLRGHLITWLDTGNGDQNWFGECKRHFLDSGMSEKVFAKTFIKTQDEFRALQGSLDKSAIADAFPCTHRGPRVRTDEQPPCKGGPQPIYGCDLHGECSIGRYCTQQTVRACTRCPDRVASALDAMFAKVRDTASDINQHCETLKQLASEAETVVEFGMRQGVSTTALLAGQPKQLITVDLHRDPIAETLKANAGSTDCQFVQASTLTLEPIPCDLLFIDTLHTYDQLRAELNRHANVCRHRIAMHDTETFGETGEDRQPGLRKAIQEFVADNPEWSLESHSADNNGLTVLSRRK